MATTTTTASGSGLPRKIEWSDDLLIGDRQIDNQHKAFFITAQKVIAACGQGKGADELARTFSFLREYARLHFAAEEERMGKTSFPYQATHKAAHKTFLDKLARAEEKLEATADKEAVAREAASIAADWFARHIKSVDRILVDYLKAHEGEKAK